MKRGIFTLSILAITTAFGQLTNNLPASGPVSIGTGTPEAGKQLTVNGATLIQNSLNVQNDLTIDGQSIFNGIVRMHGVGAYGGVSDEMEVMVTDGSGNVTKTTMGALVASIMYHDAAAEVDYCGGVDSLNPHWFNGVNKVFIPCPDVKVGIGNSAPAYKLDVTGTSFTSKLLIGNKSATTAGLINSFAQNHTTELIRLGKRIGALEEVRFVVKNDGAVEITNTGSAPSITINNGSGHAIVVNNNSGDKIAQLEGNGLLRSRKVRVDLASWADYVFKPTYHLLSLRETEAFIEENGHLPEVPNANEIETNGLDLGEMQRIQMQKIEELTLHLIEMNKTIENLESDIKVLKKENERLEKNN